MTDHKNLPSSDRDAADLDAAFKALTDHAPLPWQRRLMGAMAAGDWPDALDIPTGLGKTSAVACWLVALAAAEPNALPRRLVYVVNRRTIVDQVTEEAERLLTLVTASREPVVDWLGGRLRRLMGLSTDAAVPLTISTLRGEFADNGAWRADPTRPAIVVGTVDLIGCDLLFRGYRTSWRMRPMHAGLLGCDTAILHDEAHLTPRFQDLLDRVVELQKTDTPGRGLRCLAMSATASAKAGTKTLTLDQHDREHGVVAQRLAAVKALFVHEDPKPIEAITARALSFAEQRVRVLVYVRSPEDARKIAEKLSAKLGKKTGQSRVALLTGTLRGRERDRLLTDSAMQFYRPGLGAPPVELGGAVYMVSTSAGEVGVNLDADHLVCDLTPADALVQRLGRVNRLGGEHRQAEVHLVADPAALMKDKAPDRDARRATWKMLQELGASADTSIAAGPEAVRGWVAPATCAPEAEAVQMTTADLDALSLTSIRDDWPALPKIETLLHGLQDDGLPQTVVLWRSEVRELDHAQTDPATLLQVYRKHPPLSHERMTVRTDRVLAFLNDRVKARGTSAEPLRAVVYGQEACWLDLTADAVAANATQRRLRHATLVLPVGFGGLDPVFGILSAKADPPEELASHPRDDKDDPASSLDIADDFADAEPIRKRWLDTSGQDTTSSDHRGYREVLRVELGEEPGQKTLVFARRTMAPTSVASAQPTVDTHNGQVRDLAERFAVSLDLPKAIATALVAAAAHHDLGKDRALWQSAIQNYDPGVAYAKSGRRAMRWQDLRRYRHEVGSAIDAARAGVDDPLAQHLILSHHGRARPHFPAGLFDPDHPAATWPDEADIARRFVALQREHGPWGLAWLEALLRAADHAASADPQDIEEDADAQ